MRPLPPKKLLDSRMNDFIPAPRLDSFVKESFLNEDSKLFNEDHKHLRRANIGYLWTNAKNSRQMRQVVATCEIPKPPTIANAWQKARYYRQLREWFGTENLDFLITFDARWMKSSSPINYLATLDHELYHAGQKRNEFGAPIFSKTSGKPEYGLLGHDVEEFAGIWRRYGVKSGAGDSLALFAAGKQKPQIGLADIKAICGACRRT